MDKTYLDSDRFHINNYTRYKTFSTIKYGGCVIYVRDTYTTNMVSSLSGSNSFSDYLYVNISITGSVKPLCVGAYYRHNKHDKNTLRKFIDFENRKFVSLSFHILFSPFFPIPKFKFRCVLGKNGVGPPQLLPVLRILIMLYCNNVK